MGMTANKTILSAHNSDNIWRCLDLVPFGLMFQFTIYWEQETASLNHVGNFHNLWRKQPDKMAALYSGWPHFQCAGPWCGHMGWDGIKKHCHTSTFTLWSCCSLTPKNSLQFWGLFSPQCRHERICSPSVLSSTLSTYGAGSCTICVVHRWSLCHWSFRLRIKKKETNVIHLQQSM